MTIENLRLPSGFELRLWTRLHGDGTLFSSSHLDDVISAEKFLALYTENACLHFADTETGVYLQTRRALSKFYWHFLETMVDFDPVVGTSLWFMVDGQLEAVTPPLAKVILDYDDDVKVHRLGVMEFQKRYKNYFHGFISPLR